VLESARRGLPPLRCPGEEAELEQKRLIDVLECVGFLADALAFFEVDHIGLDKMDVAILETLVHKFSGRPVGLSTLAAAVGEEPDTLEDVYEPFLLQLGFLARTPKGRQATPRAFEHLGVAPGAGTARQDGLFER
jgi:Holliday junction DNA helicase RuvB